MLFFPVSRDSVREPRGAAEGAARAAHQPAHVPHLPGRAQGRPGKAHQLPGAEGQAPGRSHQRKTRKKQKIQSYRKGNTKGGFSNIKEGRPHLFFEKISIETCDPASSVCPLSPISYWYTNEKFS